MPHKLWEPVFCLIHFQNGDLSGAQIYDRSAMPSYAIPSVIFFVLLILNLSSTLLFLGSYLPRNSSIDNWFRISKDLSYIKLEGH